MAFVATAGANREPLIVQPTLPPARRPVLLMNPKSGGGKAERFELVERCRERGIELPLVISDHADWRELTRTIAATFAEDGVFEELGKPGSAGWMLAGLLTIGVVTGAPFPQGNQVSPGDLSLLDPVIEHSERHVYRKA